MDYETLSQAIQDLIKQGYNFDFNLHPDGLECKELKAIFGADQFLIDHMFRFEGNSNPDDSSVLYAISVSDTQTKGLLVDAYGTYADTINADMIQKLKFRKRK